MDGSFCRLTNVLHPSISGFVTNMRSRGGAALDAIQFGSYLVAQRIVKRQLVAGVARVPEVTQEALHICCNSPRLVGYCSAPVIRASSCSEQADFAV